MDFHLCALILWRSAKGFHMGKFHLFLVFCLSWFVCFSVGVIGRLCSVKVALPGNILYYFC